MTSIRWFQNAAFDAPELNSPQPCIHGAGCVYTVKDKDDVIHPGCCRFVHPGEEGTGRRLFPAKDGKPPCVRLTGKAGFYERRRLRMSWGEWCERQGIPYARNEPGVRHEPVKLSPIGRIKPEPPLNVMAMADAWPPLVKKVLIAGPDEHFSIEIRVDTNEQLAVLRDKAVDAGFPEGDAVLWGDPANDTHYWLVCFRVETAEEERKLRAAIV